MIKKVNGSITNVMNRKKREEGKMIKTEIAKELRKINESFRDIAKLLREDALTHGQTMEPVTALSGNQINVIIKKYFNKAYINDDRKQNMVANEFARGTVVGFTAAGVERYGESFLKKIDLNRTLGIVATVSDTATSDYILLLLTLDENNEIDDIDITSNRSSLWIPHRYLVGLAEPTEYTTWIVSNWLTTNGGCVEKCVDCDTCAERESCLDL